VVVGAVRHNLLMLTLVGGLTVCLEVDRQVTYTEVEDALNREGFVSSTSYLINLLALPESTRLTVSVHIPMEAITADGVPKMPAVQVMRSLASAMEIFDG